MRRLTLSLGTLACLLSLASGKSTLNAAPTMFAQSRPPDTQAEEKEVKTFTGTVVKNSGKFMLQARGNSAAYELDDQQKVGQYEGKKVKVTGRLDVANNLIHVQSIESTG